MTVSTSPSRLLVSALVLVAGFALSGCGRKAEPELPTVGKSTEMRPVGIPIGPTAPAPAAKPAEKKPFLLDFLL